MEGVLSNGTTSSARELPARKSGASSLGRPGVSAQCQLITPRHSTQLQQFVFPEARGGM